MEKVEVAPKRAFQHFHPEWVQKEPPPVLSSSQFSLVLARLEKVQPLGKLIRKGTIELRILGYSYSVDEYEHGFVRQGMYTDTDVHHFTTRYLRPVSGRVTGKDRDDLEPSHCIKIGKEWYWAHKEEYDRVRLGSYEVVQAAGPIGTIP